MQSRRHSHSRCGVSKRAEGGPSFAYLRKNAMKPAGICGPSEKLRTVRATVARAGNRTALANRRCVLALGRRSGYLRNMLGSQGECAGPGRFRG